MNRFGTFLVAAILTGATAQAEAQVWVSGTATGCFGPSCTPGAFDNSIPSLEWRGSTFDALVVGSQPFGGNPAPPLFNEDNFGSFLLSDDAYDYTGTPFLLRLTFADPTIGSVDFTATLSGAIVPLQGGGATGSVVFNFTPAGAVAVPGGAAYQLTVDLDDLEVAAHQPIAIGGTVSAVSAVPEPASVALMATGLLGLVGAAAHRRRTA